MPNSTIEHFIGIANSGAVTETLHVAGTREQIALLKEIAESLRRGTLLLDMRRLLNTNA